MNNNALLINELRDALINLLAVCYELEIENVMHHAIDDARAVLIKSGGEL